MTDTRKAKFSGGVIRVETHNTSCNTLCHFSVSTVMMAAVHLVLQCIAGAHRCCSTMRLNSRNYIAH